MGSWAKAIINTSPFLQGVRHPVSVSRGFTLTEIAIVLSVVGCILAGIFVAATEVRYHIMLSQGTDELSLIVDNVRSLYSSQNASAAPAVGFSAAAEKNFVTQKVFPQEMWRVGNNVADNPWNQSAALGSAEIEVNTPTVGQFVVRYTNLPADVCTDMLVRTTSSGSDGGLQQVQVGAAAFVALPITPVLAAGACTPGGTYTIDWYYSFSTN